MRMFLPIFAAGLACLITPAAAEEPVPKVSLTVKKQLVDSDHDLHGKQGSSAKKVLTLRVEISNTGRAAVQGATLSGTALILKAGELREALVKQPLAETAVPELRPGARVTLDMGRIVLHEREWRHRKFEESLEEWQVVCEAAGKRLGSAESSERFASLEKTAVQPGSGGPAQRKKRAKQ